MKNQILTFSVLPLTSPATDGTLSRFRGVAYSGGLIPRYGAYGDAAIDLSTINLPGEVFALVDHDPSQRAGKGSLHIEGGELVFTGEIFKSTSAGQEVSSLFAEGAPWQMSVGIQSQPEHSKKPRMVNVNNQQLTINTLFKNASIREVSFVPVGADPNTSVVAFSKLTHEVEQMEELLEDLICLLNLPKMATAVEVNSEVQKLLGKVSTTQTQLAAVEQQLMDVKLTARKADIAALFNNTELSDAETAPYLDMTDVQFSAVKNHFSVVKPTAIDPELTQEFAVSGKQPEVQETLQTLNAKMNQQVASGKYARGN